MAVKGAAHISNLHYVDANDLQIEVNYVGFHTSSIEAGLTVQVAKNATQLGMEQTVAAAVKDALVTAGMTVGFLDTVRIFGLGMVEL